MNQEIIKFSKDNLLMPITPEIKHKALGYLRLIESGQTRVNEDFASNLRVLAFAGERSNAL